MVRPELLVLNPDPAVCRFVWPGRVCRVTFLARMLADIACDNGVSLRVRTCLPRSRRRPRHLGIQRGNLGDSEADDENRCEEPRERIVYKSVHFS